jgi:hypothetical protein
MSDGQEVTSPSQGRFLTVSFLDFSGAVPIALVRRLSS